MNPIGRKEKRRNRKKNKRTNNTIPNNVYSALKRTIHTAVVRHTK